MNYKSNPRKEDERPPLESLFETEEGKRFGSQVEAAADFAILGTTLSAILPIAGSLSKATSIGIARGDLDDLVTDETPQDEREKHKAIKFLMQDFASRDADDSTELFFSNEDALWFLSLVTFSLHTYLDVYSRSIIKRIDSTPSLRMRLDKYLRERPESLTDSLGRPIMQASEVRRVGVFRRLATLEKGLGLTAIIHSVIDSEELSSIRGASKAFNRIRGTIAHSDPRLGKEHYSFRDFEKDLNEVNLDFHEFKDEVKLPRYLHQIVDLIKPLLGELSEAMKRPALVVRMAILYPALLDVAIHALKSA
ncbi:MAG: hypothetical protein ACFFER_05555 [Candidatus Thorarchaeota archaeon]